MTDSSMAGRRILLVEDEAFIALNLETLLSDAGAEVAYAKTHPEAMTLLGASRFDAAVLDVHLASDNTYAIADELRRQDTPFAFLSGYLTVREGYADIPFLTKPVTDEQVTAAITALLDKAAG